MEISPTVDSRNSVRFHAGRRFDALNGESHRFPKCFYSAFGSILSALGHVGLGETPKEYF
jgi:hypothetical protein